jgi:hypothetical protein
VARSFETSARPILPAGFQQHIVSGVDVGTLLPRGHMLHVHIWTQVPHGVGDIGGHVRIQQ